ncbi:MAG: ABC transporter substrate-binding protein [Cyclobacteriaceae bacterium]|nr:ABC transporter substrate-binding protein [Cyclobacteriaceae bacterium]
MRLFSKIFIFSFICCLSISCGGDKNSRKSDGRLIQAEGGKFFGGVFRINESEYIKNLFPHNITDAYSYRVASQIYEGLFTFDPETLQVTKGLVEDYQVDETGKIYTIQLKKGIFFHDNPCFVGGKGREMTANDVKYCFTKLCSKNINNQNFSIFQGILKGADEYYAASTGNKTPDFEVEGIQVKDAFTIELELIEPNSLLTVNLARPACFIYPKEAEDKYGVDMRINAVGTGPFSLNVDDVEEDISIILKKNPNYHLKDEFGNKLPYLDAVSIQFIKDKKTELFEFRKGNLDMIYRLPTEYIIEILEKTMPGANGEYSQFQLQRSPEMMTQFLTLNNQKGVFKNKFVRKAFNFAIDRTKILDFVLNGEGYAPGNHGITPPVFSNYNIESISGYALNIDSARYYLNKAGYGGGRGFPKLEFLLNAEGERNTNVAVEIQKQLKDHINVDVELQILPFAQLLEKSFSGDYNILRAAWVADFPSPENFLWIFSSKDVPNSLEEASYPNVARYINKNFDKYYENALKAKSIKEANEYFKKAEVLLMEDAPVIILWYDEGYRLIQSYVKNFPNNPMQYRDLGKVYFEDADTL